MVRLKTKRSLTPSVNSGAPQQEACASQNDPLPDGSSTADLAPRPSGSTGHVSANGKNHFFPGVAEKLKELVRLAQEQGYVTYGDIRETLSANAATHAELDDVCIKLRNLEVEIVHAAEVDRIKHPGLEDEEEKGRLDIL